MRTSGPRRSAARSRSKRRRRSAPARRAASCACWNSSRATRRASIRTRCHGESCPLAKGFYDRLPRCAMAIEAWLPRPRHGARGARARRSAVLPVAECALVRHGDRRYNYSTTAARCCTRSRSRTSGASACSVDEAHNLLDRARKMYSASLDRCAFARLRARGTAQGVRPARPRLSFGQPRAIERYAAHPEIPPIVSAVQNLVAAIGEHRRRARANGDALLRFHFEAIQFGVLAEAVRQRVDSTRRWRTDARASRALDGVASAGRRRVQSTPGVRNDSGRLSRRAEARATVLFSGTLVSFLSRHARVARRHGLARRRRAVPPSNRRCASRAT